MNIYFGLFFSQPKIGATVVNADSSERSPARLVQWIDLRSRFDHSEDTRDTLANPDIRPIRLNAKTIGEFEINAIVNHHSNQLLGAGEALQIAFGGLAIANH